LQGGLGRLPQNGTNDLTISKSTSQILQIQKTADFTVIQGGDDTNVDNVNLAQSAPDTTVHSAATVTISSTCSSSTELLYWVAGIFIENNAGVAGDPGKWDAGYNRGDSVRLILHVNEPDHSDDYIACCNDGAILNVVLAGGTKTDNYTVNLSLNSPSAGSVTFGANGGSATVSLSMGSSSAATVLLNGKTPGAVTIGGTCTTTQGTASTTGTVVRAELKSVEFTSDHHLMTNYNTDWTSGGTDSTVYSKPEWIAGGTVNNPISHTMDQKLSVIVTLKVEPTDVPFELTGNGAASYAYFPNFGTTSTGSNQVVPITNHVQRTWY
jgi:hypothetical protein